MPKTRAKEQPTVRVARAELRKRMKAVAAERDALRGLQIDCETLADCCDDAVESLRSAIEALSRYV